MALNSYRSALIIRIACLLIVMIAFSLLLTQSEWFFSTILLGITIVIQVVELTNFSYKYFKDIDTLIKAYEEGNFSSKSIVVKHQSISKELKSSFDRIHQLILKSRIEKEAQYNYLQILIENVPSGIIALDSSNKIVSINQAAKDILGLKGNISWSYIQNIYPAFTQQVQSNSSAKNELISLGEKKSIQISYSIASIKLLSSPIKLVNFQNIKSVLDKNEMQAWNNLIRTMTHEIMNSVTPIVSLAESGLSIVDGKNPEEISQKNLEHIAKSFSSIYNKSSWLKTFVEDYRKLIRIPKPTIVETNLKQLLNSCIQNIQSTLLQENIAISFDAEDTSIAVDPNLIEQVVMNLLKNSIEALKNSDNKEIEISILKGTNSTSVSIIDNGEGIKPENSSKIFIPFFTTKEGGSGIGLSLSKQVMQLHDGSLTAETLPNAKTCFTLHFNSTQGIQLQG